MCPSPDEPSSGSSRTSSSAPEERGGGRPHTAVQEFSAEERAWLLKLAHAAIAAGVAGEPFTPAAPSPHLAEPRGAFTTIYCRGDLRGCVGYVLPVYPLFQTVAETARSAALEDTRFWPVTRDELPGIAVSLSILSPLKPIQPEEVEVGRHGLLVSQGTRHGLLLPQVAEEHGWDRVTFLEQTCRKAGLPDHAWQKGAKLEAFTAEVFGERGAEG